MNKIDALAKFLEVDVNDLSETNDDCVFEYGREEYLVLTDDEADLKVHENILESLWAFNPEFLASHCGLDVDVIKSIQDNGKCEDNNPIFRKLINSFASFVEDAISGDGRGHFLNTYDGIEHEVSYYYNSNPKFLYIYRIN